MKTNGIKMEDVIAQLLEFIKDRDKKFLSEDPPSKLNDIRILGRTVKLGEEVGELNNDILRYLGLQRQDKLDSFKIEDLEEEFVDVLFTLLILAERVPELNLSRAIKRKIKKIKQRDNA